MSKLITVLGATGAQGGGVVEALLSAGFKVRGVTRDVKSNASKALEEKGVEVVAGNVLDLETIKKALSGAYGFFAVTNFKEKDQAGKEKEIGKNLVDVAKESKIQHFIWSSLADVEKESKGKYHVPHFSDKAWVESYAKQAGFPYHTYVAAPFYYQNWGFFKPRSNEDGSLTFNFPVPETCYLTMGDVREYGVAVAAAFKNPDGWGHGEFIATQGDHLPLKDVLNILSQHTGKKITLNEVKPEIYGKFFPGADELAAMFGWFNEFTYYGKEKDIYGGNKAKGSRFKSLAEFLKETNFQLAAPIPASK